MEIFGKLTAPYSQTLKHNPNPLAKSATEKNNTCCRHYNAIGPENQSIQDQNIRLIDWFYL